MAWILAGSLITRGEKPASAQSNINLSTNSGAGLRLKSTQFSLANFSRLIFREQASAWRSADYSNRKAIFHES
jgi:hypothetical protein